MTHKHIDPVAALRKAADDSEALGLMTSKQGFSALGAGYLAKAKWQREMADAMEAKRTAPTVRIVR